MELLEVEKKGFLNRHKESLPADICIIEVMVPDVDKEHYYTCGWRPFDRAYPDKNFTYTKEDMPSEGFLGTATVICGENAGIGFNVWAQNDSEFVWWKPLNTKLKCFACEGEFEKNSKNLGSLLCEKCLFEGINPNDPEGILIQENNKLVELEGKVLTLEIEIQLLKAKILEWCAKSNDEEFAKYFNIKSTNNILLLE